MTIKLVNAICQILLHRVFKKEWPKTSANTVQYAYCMVVQYAYCIV